MKRMAVAMLAILMLFCSCGQLSSVVSSAVIGSGVSDTQVTSTDAPETYDIRISIEGIRETMTLTDYDSGSFSIGYDSERLSVVADEAGVLPLRIASLYNTGDHTDVYIEISLVRGADEQQLLENDMKQYEGDYAYSQMVELGEAKVSGFYYRSGDEWDSEVVETYYIPSGEDCYYILTHYFFEASEGWGARFPVMISTFAC